ncbi:MAG: DNA-processing protein DprA [Defluviitaleaceae bacterium]|nr:DNA-processing protein DprA [Defluviitaleaceae bacterium]
MKKLNFSQFPTRLKNIDNAPEQLYIKGEIGEDFDNTPTVGIIGARDNSIYGRKVAQQLAQDLANCGVIIVSGMARGLDAHAHRGALDACGRTIAVLPSGVDVCYPAENFEIYKKISSHGVLVSEYEAGYRPQRWNFVARNRIISALSDILIVVEAGEKSGTFTTVNHALEQGKDVMAVPGSILSKQSIGANMLIKQGAGVVTSYLDVIFALSRQKHLEKFFKASTAVNTAFSSNATSPPQNLSLASNQSLVYSCINHESCTIDYIVYKTGLDVAQVSKALLELELAGQIKKISGNRYALS